MPRAIMGSQPKAPTTPISPSTAPAGVDNSELLRSRYRTNDILSPGVNSDRASVARNGRKPFRHGGDAENQPRTVWQHCSSGPVIDRHIAWLNWIRSGGFPS